jgi:hypothetical protein
VTVHYFRIFLYCLLQVLTKIRDRSAISSYAETGFLGQNKSFQESARNQKPDFFDAAFASSLVSSLAQQIVAADPVTALSSIEGVSRGSIENSADGTCVKAEVLQSPL